MSETADKIAKILEDPESIKMISEIAESFLSGNSAPESAQNALSAEVKQQDDSIVDDETRFAMKDLSASANILHNIIGKSDVENSIRLISALRPYMSKHRSDSAESVIKWLKALKVIGNLNLSELSGLFGKL